MLVRYSSATLPILTPQPIVTLPVVFPAAGNLSTLCGFSGLSLVLSIVTITLGSLTAKRFVSYMSVI